MPEDIESMQSTAKEGEVMPIAVSSQVVSLFRFIRLFNVSMFITLRVCETHVDALIAWDDDCRDGIPDQDDTQNIRWDFVNSPHLDDALTVGETAYDLGWVVSDKIELDETELQSALNWDAERIRSAIKTLFKLKVKMIDSGQEADSLFLHI